MRSGPDRGSTAGETGKLRGLAGVAAALVAGTLLVAAYWPVLRSTYNSWFDGAAYMEHGILVIPVAACMVWARRSVLAGVPVAPSALGAVLVLCGAAQALLGEAAHWNWVSRTALLTSLAGCIAALYGWRMLRALLFPLVTLVFMIAPPTFLFERATIGLQLLSSRLGAKMLEALGYTVLREGNVLEMVGAKLSVADACSGIRSLPAIVFVSVVYSYFFVHARLTRVLIVLLAVPIAILANASRIVATGISSQYNRQLMEGQAHEVFGYLSVAAAGAGCVAVHLAALYIQKVRRARRA